jgi:predicted RNase H-like HicB family nuclease
MKFRLVVDYDPAIKRWSAVFPDLPGCGTCGGTEEEAVENAREALALWFTPHALPLNASAKLVELAYP